jgi:hypothetical protein
MEKLSDGSRVSGIPVSATAGTPSQDSKLIVLDTTILVYAFLHSTGIS